VRELENILERAVTLCDSTTIQPDDLQLPQVSPALLLNSLEAQQNTNLFVETTQLATAAPTQSHLIPMGKEGKNEQERILHALEQTRWNRTKAATLLNMTFRQLRYRNQKYNLDPKKSRAKTIS
jgi:two-component system response regulator PilR (NtrC family)